MWNPFCVEIGKLKSESLHSLMASCRSMVDTRTWWCVWLSTRTWWELIPVLYVLNFLETLITDPKCNPLKNKLILMTLKHGVSCFLSLVFTRYNMFIWDYNQLICFPMMHACFQCSLVSSKHIIVSKQVLLQVLKHKLKDLILTRRFVFQIYTGCYDGSVQAVKLNLLQNHRCWVRWGIGSRAERWM